MKYVLNDVVMALDNGKLYEAKVLKGQNIGSTSKYFIHFQGWAKKFDVWVDEQGLALKNDAKKLMKLQETVSGTNKVTKGKNSTRLSINSVPELVSAEIDLNEAENNAKASSLIKRKNESSVTEAASQAVKKHRKQLALNELVDNEKEEQDKFYSKVVIPYNLKKHLIDEWAVVTKEPKKLINLPRSSTVENLILEFLEERSVKDKNDEEVMRYRELFELLQDNFDKALPTLLLYRQERAQYELLSSASSNGDINLRPSQVYGGEHLLRFFVRLPRMLINVFMPEKDINGILLKFADLLKFMGKNAKKYVDMGEYDGVDEAMNHLSKWKEEELVRQKSADGAPKTRHLATRRK